MGAKLHIIERDDGEWDWAVKAANGRTTAASVQGYRDVRDALRGFADHLHAINEIHDAVYGAGAVSPLSETWMVVNRNASE